MPEFLALVTGNDPNSFAEIRMENPSFPPEYLQSKALFCEKVLPWHMPKKDCSNERRKVEYISNKKERVGYDEKNICIRL